MNEIDLGAVKIVLAATPSASGKGTISQSATYATAEEAAAHAPFALVLPGNPLPGHELMDAAVLSSPAKAAALTYKEQAGHRHYVVAESPLGPDVTEGKPQVSAIGQALSEATVGGQPAALLRGANNGQHPQPLTLFWTRDGILFQVAGMGYSQEDLTTAAESLV